MDIPNGGRRKKFGKFRRPPYICTMKLFLLLLAGIALVAYYMNKGNNVQSGIDRLNNDVKIQRQKLSDINRKSL